MPFKSHKRQVGFCLLRRDKPWAGDGCVGGGVRGRMEQIFDDTKDFLFPPIRSRHTAVPARCNEGLIRVDIVMRKILHSKLPMIVHTEQSLITAGWKGVVWVDCVLGLYVLKFPMLCLNNSSLSPCRRDTRKMAEM